MPDTQIDVLAKEEQRQYARKWRAANKDKVKRYNAEYWKRKAEARLKEQEQVNGNNKRTG